MEFKIKNTEGVKETKKNSEKTLELGKTMRAKAEQTSAIVKSIDLQSKEDMQGMEKMTDGLHGSYQKAFGEQVGAAGRKIEKQGGEIRDTVNGELRNVRTGINKLEKAGGISEIGRGSVETGRAKLENSAEDYEGIANDAEQVVDETHRRIESLQKNLDTIFK